MIIRKNNKGFLYSEDLSYTTKLLSHVAVSVLKGKIPDNVISDVNDYVDSCDNTFEPNWNTQVDTTQTILDMNDPRMMKFRIIILNGCSEYQNMHLHNGDSRNFYFEGSWSLSSMQGQGVPMHQHYDYNENASRSGMTCICYTKIPQQIANNKMDGNIIFNWNSQGPTLLDDYSQDNTMTVSPKVGDFFIIPKWLSHTIYSFNGDGERRSINLNIGAYTDAEEKTRTNTY